MILVGKTPLVDVVAADHLNPQADGTVTVSNADGTVWSWQPGGFWETRPPGSAGGYERALPQGNTLVYNSIDPQGKAWPGVFAFFQAPPK